MEQCILPVEGRLKITLAPLFSLASVSLFLFHSSSLSKHTACHISLFSALVQISLMKKYTIFTSLLATWSPFVAAWDFYEPHVALEWPNPFNNPYIVENRTSFPCGRSPLTAAQRILSRFPIKGAPIEIGFPDDTAPVNGTRSSSQFNGQLAIGLWNKDEWTPQDQFIKFGSQDWQNITYPIQPWCSSLLDVRAMAQKFMGRNVGDDELEGMNATIQFTSSKLEGGQVVGTEYEVNTQCVPFTHDLQVPKL
jgi:hypothetical protein